MGDKLLEGQILHSWGDLLHVRSLYKPAVEKLEAAASLLQEVNALQDLGTTYNSLGRVYRVHGQPAAALEFQLKALTIHETSNVPRLVIQGLNAVAVTYQVLGDHDQARAYYERALAAAERTGVASYIDFMTANLGAFLSESERTSIAAAICSSARSQPGRDHTSLRHGQLADAYRKLGRHQDSLAAAERALKTCRAPAACADARVAQGKTHLALGNETAALADHKEILAAVEQMHAALAASDLLRQNFQRLWEEAYRSRSISISGAGSFGKRSKHRNWPVRAPSSTCWPRASADGPQQRTARRGHPHSEPRARSAAMRPPRRRRWMV